MLALLKEILTKVARFTAEDEPPSPVASPTKPFPERRESVTTPRETVPEKGWDDIIPEADRKKAKEEEEQKKRLQMYMGPRRKKQVMMHL